MLGGVANSQFTDVDGSSVAPTCLWAMTLCQSTGVSGGGGSGAAPACLRAMTHCQSAGVPPLCCCTVCACGWFWIGPDVTDAPASGSMTKHGALLESM